MAALPAGLAAATPRSGDARRVEERLLAPCCWAESVAFHNSPVAQRMRAEIEKLVAEGRTEPEIVDYYVERYGERILREPRGRKWLWLTLGPIVAALGGCAWLFVFMGGSRKAAASAIPAPAALPVANEELEW
jgi:cytochrome c-type biogenesis protein CcmH